MTAVFDEFLAEGVNFITAACTRLSRKTILSKIEHGSFIPFATSGVDSWMK